MTERALLSGLPSSASVTPDIAIRAMEQAGFSIGMVSKAPAEIFSYLFPVVLLLKDDAACVLLDRVVDESGKTCRYKVILPEDGNATSIVSEEELNAHYSGHCLLIKPHHKTDMRAGDPAPNAVGNWLWGTFWNYRKYYLGVIVAAFLINVLALASSFFTMNVYDRVVPTQAYATLWSLAIGVVMAMLFELCARFLRGYLIDIAGKKADLVVGTLLFRQAMAIRLEFRPASAGSFSHQLREFESVRDFATSATLATITDLPFVFLYIIVVYTIAGPLAWVPLCAIPLVLAVSFVIQYPMAKTMREHLRESSLKQGVVIEAVEGIESLKAAGAEGFMQKRWEDCSALTAQTSMKSRLLSSLAINVVTTMQQLETVVIVVWGVYLIHAGQLTMGGLIGAVILASRAVAPLGQVVGLAVRFQQAKAAMETLNRLMKMPTERSNDRTYLSKPTLQGNLKLEGMGFAYPAPGQTKPKPTLMDISLSIAAGERVAILGRIGSGKSTLLRLMAGLYQAQKGNLQVDGIDVRQIDPADWRSAVGYVGQEVRLFYGTLRDNIVMGCPDASTDEFLHVTRMTGLDRLAASHPMGYDMPIGEMGRGLSGGQQQLVALARCMLSGPRILMMDEPTSAMDLQTEAMFMNQLAGSINDRTFILVTHRFSLLKLVNRVIVVDGGRIVADGPRDEVMAALQANSRQAAAGGAPA
jgi:ATP-binding cassette subfamily C protein LapB